MRKNTPLFWFNLTFTAIKTHVFPQVLPQVKKTTTTFIFTNLQLISLNHCLTHTMNKNLLILMLIPMFAFAQKENNNWYFGKYAALGFETGIGIPKYDNPQYVYGKTASVSHPTTGQLLFYTNGKTIWDASHQIINNGVTNFNTIIGEVLSIPVAKKPNLYWLFAVHNINQIGINIIDVANNTRTAFEVSINKNFSQNLCIIRHPYKDAFWLIGHEKNNNVFHAILFDENTPLNPSSPQIITSSIGENMTEYGDMIASNQGDKIVVTHYNNSNPMVEFFSFDAVCGIVSNPILLPPPLNDYDFPYGVAFSPDDTKLYVTYSVAQSFLVQYSGSNFQTATFIATSPYNFNILRLGPDNRIYMTTHDGGIPGPRINTILKPNELGGACQFSESFIRLDEGLGRARASSFELPQFAVGKMIQSPVSDSIFSYQLACVGDTSIFKFNTNKAHDSISWRIENDTNIYNATTLKYVFKQAGTYAVQLTLYRCGQAYPLADSVDVLTIAAINFPTDTTVCYNIPVKLDAPPAQKYTWSTGEHSSSIIQNKPGKTWLKIESGHCSSTDTINIKYHSEIMIELGDEFYLCEDDSELVKLDAGEGFIQYKWTPTNDTTRWIMVRHTGDYFVKVTDNFGCLGLDETKVKRRCGVLLFFPNAFTPNNDGLNDYFTAIGNDILEFNLTIYNVWGEEVFHTNNYQNAWDGTYKNKPAPAGVYLYKSEYLGYKNKRIQQFYQSGNVSLLR
jgi:gliding motility-associated-like protein